MRNDKPSLHKFWCTAVIMPFHFYPGYESDDSEKALPHIIFCSFIFRNDSQSFMQQILRLPIRKKPAVKKMCSPEQPPHWFIPCISFSWFLIKFSTWAWIRTLSRKPKLLTECLRHLNHLGEFLWSPGTSWNRTSFLQMNKAEECSLSPS